MGRGIFMHRLVLVSILLAGWLLTMPSGPAANPVVFDDFNDNAINPSLWRTFQQGSGPQIVETNQRLEITLPALSADDPGALTFSAGYGSVCRLRGDFDIQVDYELLTWPLTNGVRIGLLGDVLGGVERVSGGGGDGSTFGRREVYVTHFTQSCCGFVNTNDLAGTLRLVRTGNMVAGFFFRSSDNSWIPIGSSAATSVDTNVSVSAWSHDFAFADQDVKVAFDNVILNSGQLTCLANAGPDQSVEEGSTVVLDASNSGGTAITLSWEQLAGPTVTLSDPTSATPTFTAPALPGGFGSQVLTFKLTVQSGGDSSTDTVDVTVSNVNHDPEADAGSAQTVKELSRVTLDATSSFDPDGDPITYAWTQIAGLPVTLDLANTATPAFDAPDVSGGVTGPVVLTFEVTVSDGSCLTCSSRATVTVTVEQINHAPIADAGEDQTRNEAGVVTLNAAASSDPDNDPILSYVWTQTSGKPVTLSDPASAMPSFTAPATGPGGETLVFSVIVSDGQLDSEPAQVRVHVLDANDPPRCDLAMASPRRLWPPDHKLIRVGVTGITDPSTADVLSITFTGVTQNEPVNGLGDGDTGPDAVLQGDHVLLRAERGGTANGRVYRVHFLATDAQVTGESCTGVVTVEIPLSAKADVLTVDDGEVHDSTQP